MLEVPVVTDDRDMAELGQVFGIKMWGLLDLLKIMHTAGRIDWKAIKALTDYLEYIKDPTIFFVQARGHKSLQKER